MELPETTDWYLSNSYHRGLRATVKRLEDYHKEEEKQYEKAKNKNSSSNTKKPPTNKVSNASFKAPKKFK